MKEVLDIPRTAMEVYETLPEGTRCEVIDNNIYMSPSPSTNHQDILLTIATELRILLKGQDLGKVFVSPCDVYLDNDETVVQPDILFIAKQNESIIEKKGIFGSPDFVIELLSSNRSLDQTIKLELYERNGIPEYHIIDPDTKEVWSYILDNGGYRQQPSSANHLHIRSIDFKIDF